MRALRRGSDRLPPGSLASMTLEDVRDFYHDPERFEIAADYDIPLFFILTGIFRISEALSDRLRGQRLLDRVSALPPGRVGVSDEELPCPYRAVSRGSQEDHDLMELRWPLVLTTCY